LSALVVALALVAMSALARSAGRVAVLIPRSQTLPGYRAQSALELALLALVMMRLPAAPMVEIRGLMDQP
jgi:hypothetical protein